MAFTNYTLPKIYNLPSGIATVILRADVALTTPTTQTILSIGSVVESIDEDAGVIDQGSVDMSIVDNAAGFWDDILSAGPVYLRIMLDEGDGDKLLFTGVIDQSSVSYNYSDTSVFRIDFTVFNILTAMRDKTLDGLIGYLISAATSTTTLEDFTTISYDVDGPVGPENGDFYIFATNELGEASWYWINHLNGDAPIYFDAVSGHIHFAWAEVVGATSYVITGHFRSGVGAYQWLEMFSGAYPEGGEFVWSGGGTGHTITANAIAGRYKLITLRELLGKVLEYGLSDVPFSYLDVTWSTAPFQFSSGATTIDMPDAYVLLNNRGELSADIYVPFTYSVFFDSTSEYYLGDKVQNLFALYGAICKQWGIVVNMGWTTKHVATVGTRSISANDPVVMPKIMTKTYIPQSFIYGETFRAVSENNDALIYEVNPTKTSTPALDISCYWVNAVGAMLSEKYTYYLLGSISAITGYYYWDGSTYRSTLDWLYAVVKYYQGIYGRSRKSVMASYGSLKANPSTTNTQADIRVLSKSEIDGITYYANRVEKNILTNELIVEWVEE